MNAARRPARIAACAALLSVAGACGGSEAPVVETPSSPAAVLESAAAPRATPAVLAEPAPPDSAPPAVLPSSVDLRAELTALGLPPRAQGARGTCSIFTTCSALEFALAKHRDRAQRLSTEFLNWSASQAAGAPSDGNFFHNALAGLERFGICAEELLPYRASYDAALAPSADVLASAAEVREECASALSVRWIVPWKPDRFGVDDAQFAEIRSVLARGFPVAAGSGHSRLLVGYRDDPALPGGGAFLTEDSALARFDEVTYEFVRAQVADVFWVEAR